MSFANRDANDVLTLSRWQTGATVGSGLVKAVTAQGTTNCCFNRAPTGHPSIEMWSINNQIGVCNFDVQLWNMLNSGGGAYPRWTRVVFELKTCKTSDPTTYKGQGGGATGGSYPNWSAGSVGTNGKYFIGQYAGVGPAGGGNTNWYDAFNPAWSANQDGLRRVNRAGYRMTFGGGGALSNYVYAYDRPGTLRLGACTGSGTGSRWRIS